WHFDGRDCRICSFDRRSNRRLAIMFTFALTPQSDVRQGSQDAPALMLTTPSVGFLRESLYYPSVIALRLCRVGKGKGTQNAGGLNASFVIRWDGNNSLLPSRTRRPGAATASIATTATTRLWRANYTRTGKGCDCRRGCRK